MGELIAPLLQQRVELLTEIPEKIAFLAELPEYPIDFFFHQKNQCSPEVALAMLKELKPLLRQAGEWTAPALTATVRDFAVHCGLKLGLPMWALRIALSGRQVTPGGPAEIMAILGPEESFRRLDRAIERLAGQ